jgi:integrase
MERKWKFGGYPVAIEQLGETPLQFTKKKGTYADGKGLYLRVRAKGQGSWSVVFGGKERCIGPADLITPDEARALHKAMRLEKKAGRDPWSLMTGMIETKKEEEKAATNRKRFADVVESAIPILATQNEWKGTSTEARKYGHLKDGALGRMWTDEIDQTHIADELTTRWGDALASADKYRMRIKAVLEHATANKWRPNTPNPADKKIMKHLIAKPPKSRPHPSMPVALVPEFMDDLLDVQDPAARALAFAIHTVARSGEAIGARWEEIEGNVWHVPALRMKEGATNGDHWVPLSPAALLLLGKTKKSGRIFDGLPHDALDDKLKEVSPDMLVPVPGHPDMPPAVHGFRTSFTGWAEKTGQPSRLWDRAMHHSSKVGGSYSREPLTEERRSMMVAYSDFLTG